jgi:uncharacterized protein (DUF305 family)
MKPTVAIPLAILAAFCVHLFAQEKPEPKKSTTPHHQMQMTGDMAKDMRMMNEMTVKKLGKGDAEYDKRFIDMMIPHHEGAVLMAKDALKNSNRKEIRDMAEKMIKAQEEEIAELRKLRSAWYGEK